MDYGSVRKDWDLMSEGLYEAFTSGSDSYSMAIEWPAVRRILPVLKGKRALDLGCGTGRFTFLLEALGPKEITGIDISPGMLEQACLKAKSTESCARFIECSMDDLGAIPDQWADFVFSSTATHYLPELGRFMRELRRVLAPEGSAVLSVIHPVYSAQYPIEHEDGRFPDDSEWQVRYLNREARAYMQPWVEYCDWVDKYLSHSKHYTMGDYLNAIIQADLTLVQLLEPAPPEEWKERKPGRYRAFVDIPTYAIFHLERR